MRLKNIETGEVTEFDPQTYELVEREEWYVVRTFNYKAYGDIRVLSKTLYQLI